MIAKQQIVGYLNNLYLSCLWYAFLKLCYLRRAILNKTLAKANTTEAGLENAIYGTTENDYLMSPNFYTESDTLYNGEYGFSGSREGWEFFWFNLWWRTPVKFIPYTIKYRFTFISDSIHNPREGWMLDDFYIATYPIGSIGEYLNTISIKIAPNPVKNYTRIQFDNSTNESYELKVFNIDGKLVKSYPSVTESEVLFERAELASGLYFVEILRNHTSLGRSTMILE